MLVFLCSGLLLDSCMYFLASICSVRVKVSSLFLKGQFAVFLKKLTHFIVPQVSEVQTIILVYLKFILILDCAFRVCFNDDGDTNEANLYVFFEFLGGNFCLVSSGCILLWIIKNISSDLWPNILISLDFKSIIYNVKVKTLILKEY